MTEVRQENVSGAQTSVMSFAKLPIFNGETKAESPNFVSYKLWKYSFENLKEQGAPEKALKDAIISSVRGKAAEIVISLPVTSSSTEITERLKLFFSNLTSKREALKDFYTCEQKSNENALMFRMRLELLLSDCGDVDDKDKQLIEQFHSGLNQIRLKDLTLNKSLEVKKFEDFFSFVMQCEQQINLTARKVVPVQVCAEDSTISDLRKELEELKVSFNEVCHRQERNMGRVKCYRCGKFGHIKRDCNARLNRNEHRTPADSMSPM